MGDVPYKARVLIVDDDRTMLQSLQEMVIACEYEPVPAATWSDAIRLFRQQAPDLVLLDVMMPGMDGYKLARMLKSQSTGFVPVILLTALEDIESKRRGMAAGADDFLSKPTSQLELQIRLSSMLRIKELTDQLHEANEKLARLAVTDSLTGLHNRRALDEHLEREFARSQRYGHPFAVAMLDIDHFKQVNDTYGHAVGDRVIELLGQVLREATRQTDLVGRYGGEEFVVVAPETPADKARIVAERIRSQVPKASAAAPGLPTVTVSIGLASSDVAGVSRADELIRKADEALYEAKRRGRDRWVDARELERAG